MKQTTKAQKAATNKKYYEKHKDEIAEKKKRHYREHKDEYAERMKKYYLNHKDELSEKHKKYNKERRYTLTKKQEKLIDIISFMPCVEDINYPYEKSPTDHRGDVEESLIQALEVVSKGTKNEDLCKEVIEKARKIFSNCSN